MSWWGQDCAAVFCPPEDGVWSAWFRERRAKEAKRPRDIEAKWPRDMEACWLDGANGT